MTAEKRSEASSAPAGSHGRRRPWLYLLVALFHLALTTHFVSLAAIFGDEPISGDDFDLHIGQTFRVLEGLEGWGHAWVYDVDILAGEPAGVIVDSGNKGWSLWTYALHSLGVSRAVAFNTFILFGHLLVPLAVFFCARSFGLLPLSALFAAGAASLFWFFDSFSHWVWWVGMCSYAAASSFALIPLGLFNRFVSARARWAGVSCAPLLGASLLIHPYSFFILVVPMGLLYLRGRRELQRVDHALVAGIVATALAMNAYWLHNALSHWHYILNSAYFGQTGPGHLLADFLSVLLDPSDTGVIGTRTGFRFLLCGMAVAGIIGLRRAGERRLLPLSAALIFLLVLAYLGGYIPGAQQIQPYRHVLPAGFIAAILAGAFVEQLVLTRALVGLAWAPRACLVIASLVATQHLARDVLYFMPGLVPEAPALIDDTPSPISGYGYLNHFRKPEHLPFRIPHEDLLQVGIDAIVDWVEQNVEPGQRIAVDHAVLGERIAWKTDVEVLGAFRERNIGHAYANFFRRFGKERVAPDLLGEYLRTYAVSMFLVREPRKDLDAATSLVRRSPGPPGVYVYRVLSPTGFIIDGPGRVVARTNRIELFDTDPTRPVQLSYHYHEALICRPGCQVERLEMALDEVGLIRIPAPHPRAMVIENSYR